MSAVIAFDTLAYAKRLKAAGVPEIQAEVHAEAMAELVEDRLATKLDIELVRRDMKELETNLRHDMKAMESSLIIKLGGIVVVAIGTVAAIVKIL